MMILPHGGWVRAMDGVNEIRPAKVPGDYFLNSVEDRLGPGDLLGLPDWWDFLSHQG